MKTSPIRGFFFLAPAVLALYGCGDGGVQEIKAWMDQVRRETKIVTPVLSEPKKFSPYTYGGKNSVDPFNPAKLAAAFARLKGGNENAFKPDLERRREPLEAYPLDSMKMVGTLHKPGLTYAILQVDKMVFQVKVGNYVGQNFGMITNITDGAVDVREVIQDAAGEWVERNAKLELQETKK